MIYKRNLLYLKKQKARQTFANLPDFGCIHEGLFRIYTSWWSAYKNQKYSDKTKVEKTKTLYDN